MKRRIRIVIPLAMLAIALGIGLWLWNKPHRKAENQTGIAISADSLVALYNTDENAANTRFLDKVIAVSGTTDEAGSNGEGAQTILMHAGDAGNVFCTMRKGEKITDTKAGEHIVVKGFCSGKTIDVTLTDCVPAQ